MSFQQFLLALRGRIGIFLTLLATTVVAAFLVTLVMPKTYEAITSVLVDVKDEQMLNAAQQSARAQLGYMQTQIDIIQSQRVARRVVQDLKLAESPGVHEAFIASRPNGTIEDWVASGLLQNLKVDSSQSSVILLRYTANDSRFAAQVANAFAKAYVDTTLNLRVEPTREAATWFGEQLNGLRKSLEESQAKLAKFQRDRGILATDERLDIESARLAELSNQSLRASDLRYDAAAKLGQTRNSDNTPEVLANGLVQSLKGQLLTGEAKLQELSTRLGPNHPQYVQQQAEVEALRTRVQQETRRVVGGVAASSAASAARESALKSELAAQRKRVEDLRDARNEAVVLQRDVDTAQKAYEAAQQRFVVNKVESGAKSTNVTILNPAVEPNRPLRPRLPINLALGLFVGMILGFGAVFFMELLDRRVRSTDDLEIGIDAPLIGTLQPWQPSSLLAGSVTRALPSPA